MPTLEELAKEQQTTVQQPQQPVIGAANTQNKAVDFNQGASFVTMPKADEDLLPLQIMNNNQISFLQKDKRTPQQRASIAKFLNKAYGASIPEDGNPRTENLITQVYNKNQATVPTKLIEQGYIAHKQNQQAPPPQPKTVDDLITEAKEKNKSFLQLYQENMQKPEYEQERADRIQKHSKASIIADIIKLIGEGVTTNKGGTPIVRQSAVPMLNAELQKLNDTYKAEARAYKQGGFNAVLMDEQDKRRTQAVEAARKASLQQALLTQASQAEREIARQKATSEEKEKDRRFTAEQKSKDRSTTITAAQIRKANNSSSSDSGSGSGSRSSTTNERGDILIDGKIVKPKQAYVNDVVSKVRTSAKVTDPVLKMSATEVFAANWNKYYDYVNGEFVPKGTNASNDPLNIGVKKTKSNPLGLNL
jgi:hypothetical protein